jgi:putative salt-induced outer membrane protein YdiY
MFATFLRALFVFALLIVCADPSRSADPDVIMMKDGSVIYGEVVDLSGGKLRIKTGFSAEETTNVKWENVKQITLHRPVPFNLKDGTSLVGKAELGQDGTVKLKIDPVAENVIVPMDQIVAINPPPVKAQTWKGSLTLGGSGTEGNTRLKNVSMLGEFETRTEKQRLTAVGRYVYGDDRGRLIARNSRGSMKYDWFVSKRAYWFASAYVEQDTFQDLKMRTAFSTGPGWQMIDKGDFSSNYLKGLTLFGEAGFSYFNEDFKLAADKSQARLRWSVKMDWPVVPDKVTLYHFHEAFPSLADKKDFYVTSDQGIRLNVTKNFVTNFQLTYRYNANPPAGLKKGDTLYFVTLGYSFSDTD